MAKPFVDAIAGRQPDSFKESLPNDQEADLRKFPMALLGSTEQYSGPNDVSRQGQFRDFLVGGQPEAIPGTGAAGMYLSPNTSVEKMTEDFGPNAASAVQGAANDGVSDTVLVGEAGDPSAVAPHELRHRAWQFNRPELMEAAGKSGLDAVGPIELGGQPFSEEEFLRLMDAATDPNQFDEAQKYMDSQNKNIDVRKFLQDENVRQRILDVQERAAELAQQRGAPRPYTHFNDEAEVLGKDEQDSGGILETLFGG